MTRLEALGMVNLGILRDKVKNAESIEMNEYGEVFVNFKTPKEMIDAFDPVCALTKEEGILGLVYIPGEERNMWNSIVIEPGSRERR
jgi:hypothetical protein